MIGFLHPWVLAGLLAAGIPLLLHLITRREAPTVIFPAVRYLLDTTREHQRRLRIRHWLLLLIRTILVGALVLAAAGPTAPVRGVAGHAPAALVLVVDNSLSSGAVRDGVPRLEALRGAARDVLARATAADALWLVTADGVPRRGDPVSLRVLVDSLHPSPLRLDLGAAIALGGDLLSADTRPGTIVLATDLQATAVTAAEPRAPILVVRPAGLPPPNTGVGGLDVGAQPWTQEGGRVTVSLAGDSGRPVPVSARAGDRPEQQALAAVGAPVTLALRVPSSGWWPVKAELDPDELRADDARTTIVRVASPARVAWSADDRYIGAACAVLEEAGRIRRGLEITLGRLGAGASVVPPPEESATVGALNRALEARGVAWRFGAPVLARETSDSGALLGPVAVSRRYALLPVGSGSTGVVVTVRGAPWIVHSEGVVLLGSRLDPAWTDLPAGARFVPFLDALLNRVARGDLALTDGTPGDPIPLPDRATAVRRGEREWPVEGGAVFRAPEPGVYAVLAGRDTIGALAVNPDPRESLLRPAADGVVERLWRGARIVDPAGAGEAAFALGMRSDLRGPLLLLALLLGLAEVGLASVWRRRA